MPNNDPWDLGGGGESFPFDHINDSVEGYIQDMVDRQGTDMQTGELAWWDKECTRPVMLKVVTLQTNLRENPADDGKRNVTLSGSKKPNPDGTMSKMAAALRAVKEATGGATAFQFNAWFKLSFTSEGIPTQRGFSAPKYYQAWYRPPVMELDGNDQTAPVNQTPATYGQPAQGANWPAQNAGPGPDWAQGGPVPGPISRNLAENLDLPDAQRYPAQAAPPPRQPDVAQGGTLAGEPITMAAVEAIQKAGMRPEDVFGADWRSRVTG